MFESEILRHRKTGRREFVGESKIMRQPFAHNVAGHYSGENHLGRAMGLPSVESQKQQTPLFILSERSRQQTERRPS
jgi:hypothetical protein